MGFLYFIVTHPYQTLTTPAAFTVAAMGINKKPAHTPHAGGPGAHHIGNKHAARKVQKPGFYEVKGPIGFPTFGDPRWWAGEPVNIEPLRGLPSMTGRD